jgi:hypothetical protein
MKQEVPIENREDIIFDFIKKELGIFEIEKELRDLEKNLEIQKIIDHETLRNTSAQESNRITDIISY